MLYIAVSLDWMIAKEDGSIDWLDEFEGEGDNGYSDFYQTVDTVILGRSTYEHVKVLTPVFPYQDKTCYVFTGSPDSYQDEHVTFINEGARAFTARLKQEKGSNIWIAGGRACECLYERRCHRRIHHHCYSRRFRKRHPAVSRTNK